MIITRWKVVAVLLILGTVPVVSCIREEPGRRPPVSYVDRVNALINSPVKRLGESQSSIQAKLGAPSTVNTEPFANQHDPEQMDQIHTLTYQGLVIRLYDVVAFKKEMLLSVRMTENRPGVLPGLIGQDKRAVSALFGAPNRSMGKVFKYISLYNDEPGEDVVKIEFRNSIVEAVEWNFYVD